MPEPKFQRLLQNLPAQFFHTVVVTDFPPLKGFNSLLANGLLNSEKERKRSRDRRSANQTYFEA